MKAAGDPWLLVQLQDDGKCHDCKGAVSVCVVIQQVCTVTYNNPVTSPVWWFPVLIISSTVCIWLLYLNNIYNFFHTAVIFFSSLVFLI